jgi:VanZ family protein
MMTERQQRVCIWGGITFAPLFLVGFWLLAGFIPPPAPGMSAEAVARMFAEGRGRIRTGLWVATAAAPFLAFFVAALTHQIRRIAGSDSPLATAQLIAGSCLVLEFIFPQLVWQTAAYRSERSPETIQMLNDLAWLPYVGVVGTAMVQMAIIAIVVFTDRHQQPLLPRWSAYLNIWTALGVAPGSFVVFVHSGPVAWNGILAWWLLCVSFFVWMVAMTWLMLRASHIAEGEEGKSRSGAKLQPTAR